ncbi:glycoside hydrolase family 25 protein [Nocardioides alcanivorans]|uniref:glycoside hydrolase family 25 protein n=1 Tax=Nocardioides alcanivorans TaxID=2897352 RepID=UPI001F260C0D|nr:GH25 family lysozyme [Nocardioides alcanivorans]
MLLDDATAAASAETSPLRAARHLRGVDVSHHQGWIDWERVANDRVDFAWLKATEGTSHTDPTYVDNRDRARAAGLRVGGYHYFSICSDGAPQAEHFVKVVGDQSDSTTQLPPAVDVELDPDCNPTREVLLNRLSDFIRVAEKGTGRTVIVYAFPDLERRYKVSEKLDRPRWVRKLGDREPGGNWLVWQKSQTAEVEGISTPVDLDLMRH